MNKNLIGILFIIFGLAYGSLAIDKVYSLTLGYLVKNNWIKPPSPEQIGENVLGRKPTILIYSLVLILIGILILWTPLD